MSEEELYRCIYCHEAFYMEADRNLHEETCKRLPPSGSVHHKEPDTSSWEENRYYGTKDEMAR